MIISGLVIWGVLLSACAAPTSTTAPASPTSVPGAVSTPSYAQYMEKLAEEAKKEGKLMIYLGTPLTYSDKLVAKFNQKYTFLKVEHYYAGIPAQVERIRAEASAQRWTADVISTGGAGDVMPLVKEGIYDTYRPYGADAYPKDSVIDPPGLYPDRVLIYAIAYNTKVVSPEQAKELQNWQALLDPKWKGKIAFPDPQQVGGGYTMIYMFYKLFGEDFVKKFAANTPATFRSNETVATMVVTGEYPIGVSIESVQMDKFDEGAPVALVYPSPTPADFRYTGLAAHAPHPNAAKLFIEWFLSEEGQQVWQAIYNAGSMRAGIKDARKTTQAPWYKPPAKLWWITDLDGYLKERKLIRDEVWQRALDAARR